MALPGGPDPDLNRRDKFDAIDKRLTLTEGFGVWTTWTPTLTNLTLGNGTVTARYCQIGKVVHFRFWFKLGSTSAVGSLPTFSLPVTTAALLAASSREPIGLASYDRPGTAHYFGRTHLVDTDTANLFVGRASGTYEDAVGLSSTVPLTWTTNDEISVQGTYEAA